MVTYFSVLDEKYGFDLGRRFEDGSIHSLPQDYADMIGWEEFATLADSAYRMIEDKGAALIYAENYGQAGAITIIGKSTDCLKPSASTKASDTGSPASSRLKSNR